MIPRCSSLPRSAIKLTSTLSHLLRTQAGSTATATRIPALPVRSPAARGLTGLAITQRVSRYGPDSLQPLEVPKKQTGQEILYDPLTNKGIAFPPRERDRFGLRGLLPPRVMSIEEQVKRAYLGFQRAGAHGRNQHLTPTVTQELVDKHIYLSNLQDRNEVLFHRLLSEHLQEMAPIVYTPVVGYACQHTGELWRRSRGLWIDGHADRGDMHSIVNNWPTKDVDVIVITDGSRILGLGDLGAYGMGIPIGKLITYVAAAGIHPSRTLPMFIDMGTDNPSLHSDPLYLGQKKPRLTGAEYLAVFDELMDAITYRWPQALVQFEDIRTPYAEMVLSRYRRFNTCFNDDIQGTGSMVVAGVLAALRVKGKQSSDIVNERILCVGAGSAGLGVCSSVRRAMKQEGLPNERSYSRFWVTDKDGLLTKERSDLMSNQENYARDIGEDRAFLASPEGEHDRDAGCDFDLAEGMPLEEVVRRVKPTILLGLSGVGGIFTENVVKAMTDSLAPLNERPVIFALSNPTDKSECTAEQVYDWTQGRAIAAFGSPFPPVVRDGKTVMVPAQGNNIFIYPGVGLACVATRAKRVTDEMFYEASKALANALPKEDMDAGRLFCSISNIREVSHKVACAVAKVAREQGECTEELPPYKDTWEQYISDLMWRPEYQPIVAVDST